MQISWFSRSEQGSAVNNESAAVQAVMHLADETKPDDDVWFIIFTACSFVVLFLLGLVKYISNKVNSSSLKKVATEVVSDMFTTSRSSSSRMSGSRSIW